MIPIRIKRIYRKGRAGTAAGRAPDAFGESGQPTGGPYAAARKPAGAPRTAPRQRRRARARAAARTFRVRPARWGRRGFASRRPPEGGGCGAPSRLGGGGRWPWRWRALLVVAPATTHQSRFRRGLLPLPPSRRREEAHGIRLRNQDGYRGGTAAGTISRRRPGRRDAGRVPAGGTQGPGHRGTDLYRARLASGDRAACRTKEWRLGKEAELAKLQRAVKETAGVVMTYEGQPITAFSPPVTVIPKIQRIIGRTRFPAQCGESMG